MRRSGLWCGATMALPSDKREPQTLPWHAGARRCRMGIMILLLRPPTDGGGVPAVCVCPGDDGACGAMMQ